MLDWFEQLAPRERLLVTVAGALTIGALIVTLAIRPLFSQAALAEQRVNDKQALLLDLERVASRLGTQRGAGAAAVAGPDNRSLVVLIDQTTRAAGLAGFIKRNQPDGNDSIRLRFENAPFDSLLSWLTDISARHGLSADNANIDSAQESGRVNCNLVLTRAGGRG